MSEELEQAKRLLEQAMARVPEMDRLRAEHHRLLREREEAVRAMQERHRRLFAKLRLAS